MNTEIFTKDGTIRKSPPPRYECTKCGHLMKKPAIMKVIGATFLVCHECFGRIQERSVYIEWNKRKSGQWDTEQQILSMLNDGIARTKDEIQSNIKSDKWIFGNAFSDLCYHQKISIHNEDGIFTYSI